MFDNYELRIKNLIKKYDDFLIRNPNVFGVALGNKIVNGYETKEPVITFFVEKKLSIDSLDKDSIIPQSIYGARTDIIATSRPTFMLGRAHLDVNGNIPKEPDENYIPPVAAASGGCLSLNVKEHGKDLTVYSTLGGIVTKKNNDGKIHLITCAHLVADAEYIADFNAIIYYSETATKDHLEKRWPIGRLGVTIPFMTDINSKMLSFESEMDVAIVNTNLKLDNININKIINTTLINGDYIKKAVKNEDLKIGLKVYKYGTTTKRTEGQITNTDASIEMRLSPKRVMVLKNQIFATSFARHGDSAALGIIEGTKEVFGIFSCGVNDKDSGKFEYGVYCNINRVLDKLGFKL